jgi:hypothetical protein
MMRPTETLRRLTKSRLASVRGTKPWLAGRGARYLGVEALEERISPDTALYAGGLEFLAKGSNPWTGPAQNQTTTAEVQIGLTPQGTASFSPELDVKGGFSLSTSVSGANLASSGNTAAGTASLTALASAMTIYNGPSTIIKGVQSLGASGDDLTSSGGITTNLTIAGFSFTTTQLALTGALPVQATGSISVEGFTIPISSPNVVRINASGASLASYFAVTLGSNPSVSIGGASFNLGSSSTESSSGGSVTAGYDPSANSGAGGFFVDGSASFDWGSNNKIELKLGDPTTSPPTDGMVFSSAGLSSIDASVTGSFAFGSALTVTAKDLTLDYSSATSTYVIYGDAGLTVGSGSMIQSVDVTLGSASGPGLVISNANNATSLTSLGVTLNGKFSLGGLTVSPTDLTLNYDDSEYQVSGGLEVDLTDDIKVSSSISSGTPLIINATTGQIDLTDGFGLSLAADIEGFELSGSVTYTQPAGGGYDVVTNASLTTPGGIGFQAYLDIANGQLQDIGIGISGPLELGDTGLVITWVFGSLQNINTSDPTITAAATLEYGDPAAPILEITGAIQISKEELLVSADPDNPPLIYSNGIVSEADHPLGILIEGGAIGQFTGSVDLDWSTGVYMVSAAGSLLDGMATLSASMTLTSAGDLSFSAEVGVNVPDAVPLIGGMKLLTMDVLFDYQKGAPSSDDFIAAWGSIAGLGSAGFEYTFDGKFHFLDSSGITRLEDSVNDTVLPATVVYKTDTIVVPADQDSLQYTVSDPLLDKNVWGVQNQSEYLEAQLYQSSNWVQITDPDGNVYYGNLGVSAQGTNFPGEVIYDQTGGTVIQPYVSSVDPITGSTLMTSRVFSFDKDPGSYVTPGTWTFSLVDFHNTDSASFIQALLGSSYLQTHVATEPNAPDFGGHIVSEDDDSYVAWVQSPPSVTQETLDTIQVSIPIDVYNPGSNFNVSVYATDTPLATVDGVTTPVAESGDDTLVFTGSEPFVANQGQTTEDSLTFSTDVLTSTLPTVPDGRTPVYFYVVVDDGINAAQQSAASAAFVPSAYTPQITAPAVEVVSQGQGFNFNLSATSQVAGNDIQVNAVSATQTVTISALYGTLNFTSGSLKSLDQLESSSTGLQYTPQATGLPGFDTITITATNTVIDGAASDVYTATDVIQIVPPNNVDLQISQDVYGPNSSTGNLLASTDGGAVDVTPASVGATLDFRLHLSAGTTIASTAPTANGVTVQYAIPSNIQFVSATASQGTYNPTTGIWTVGTLTPGAAAVTLDVKGVVAAGSAGNAIVSAATAIPGNNPNGTPQLDINPANNVTAASLQSVAPITGLVYLATTGGGADNPLNVGAANITVQLFDTQPAGGGSPKLIATTTTNAAGWYGFASPGGSGSYEVEVFGNPTQSKASNTYNVNLIQSPKYWFMATLLQPSSISGKVTMAHGNAGTTLPASAFSAASGELVYLDLNNDGLWDPGDPTTTTDTNGNFTFTDLAPGTYTVRELLGSGLAAVGAGSVTVTIGDGKSSSSLALSFEDPRTIWGYQFVDANDDWTDDPGDTGQSGWEIDLLEPVYSYGQWNSSTTIASTTTGPNGMFQFDNLELAPGQYAVGEVWNPNVTGTVHGEFEFEVNSDGTITLEPNGPSGADSTNLGQNWVGDIHVGDQSETSVTPSPAPTPDALEISTIPPLTAGQLTQFTVTAVGANGAVDPNYTGTIQVATDDPNGFVGGTSQIQSDVIGVFFDDGYTFQPSDHGVHTFDLMLMTDGIWTVNVDETASPGVTVASDPIVVGTGQASQCIVEVPSAVVPGQTFDLSLHPVDSAGNAQVNYWGTADISVALEVDGVDVSDAALPADLAAWIESGAGLPSTHQFTLDDHGTHSFTLQAPTLSASDLATLAALGISPTTPLNLVVNVADPQGLVALGNVSIAIMTPNPITAPSPTPTSPQPTIGVTFQGPTEAIAGIPTNLNLNASAIAGLSAAGSVHTIHFTSTDPAAVLPSDTTFTLGGTWSQEFVVTFDSPGAQLVTAIDTSDGAVVGQESVMVRAAQATPAARMVDTVFQVLVGQSADADDLAQWGPMIAKGVSASHLVAAVTRSAEYINPEVEALYEHLLGRAPTAAESQAALTRLQDGASIQSVEVSLLGGVEFAQQAGGQRSGFLADLAEDLLGRPLTAREEKMYSARLARGATRESVAAALLKTPAAARLEAEELYDELLFRAPTSREIARLAPSLETARGRDTAVARIVDSPEFRELAGDQVIASRHASERTDRPVAAHPKDQLRPASLEKKVVYTAGPAHAASRFARRSTR